MPSALCGTVNLGARAVGSGHHVQKALQRTGVFSELWEGQPEEQEKKRKF